MYVTYYIIKIIIFCDFLYKTLTTDMFVQELDTTNRDIREIAQRKNK